MYPPVLTWNAIFYEFFSIYNGSYIIIIIMIGILSLSSLYNNIL